MCGICGIYGAPDKVLAKKMADVMRHRGPDGEGFYEDGAVSLGHRRLAIIDLSARGNQPMCNEDGTVWISFNGEIYNFKELRAELERKGHEFKSASDTEAVIHLYEQEGLAALKRLNGIFGFALWDSRKKRLLLARDRMGVKPLF
ncbi:MAG: asparagine synthetase B family protein, partial [Candidatus Micrarchaeia archaeon]